MRTSFVTGLESWFTLPAQPGLAPPPPYKMALLTWITIFPLITAIVALTGPLLEGLPLVPAAGDHDRPDRAADDLGGDAPRDPGSCADRCIRRTLALYVR